MIATEILLTVISRTLKGKAYLMDSLKKLMDDQIEERARIYHNGDKVKAAEQYFRDHPEWYADYCKETTFPVGAVIVDSND